MAGLGQLKYLRKLDLGANRIRDMDEKELSGLENLEELWIGKNKIEMIQGLEKVRFDLFSGQFCFLGVAAVYRGFPH
jgi:Leucine-rich repeat (LRR) protein